VLTMPCVPDQIRTQLSKPPKPRRFPSEVHGFDGLDKVAQRPEISSEGVERKRIFSRRDEKVVEGEEDQVGCRVGLNGETKAIGQGRFSTACNDEGG
jgi:hypothetical protein